MKKLEEVQTPFNRVEVWQNNAGRIDFEVSGATHATWHPTHLLTGHAWDAITAAILSHPDEISSILLLGLGGGTCLRQLRHLLPDAEITAVEIDGNMIDLARRYMKLDELRVNVIEDDAFRVLESAALNADVVIDDLYHALGNDVERPKPITENLLASISRRIPPNGSVAMNFVVGPGHHDVFQQACAAFRSFFPQTRRIIPPHSHNEVLMGSLHPKPLLTQKPLRRKHSLFPLQSDQDYWKELRSLKLP